MTEQGDTWLGINVYIVYYMTAPMVGGSGTVSISSHL